MTLLRFARQRTRAFLAEIANVAQSEFPYSDSKEALQLIEAAIIELSDQLDQFDDKSDPATVRLTCSISLRALFLFLPVLGFILRSTNVRNGFEVWRPLLRLSRQILEPEPTTGEHKTRLVLSSEWVYSPFIYAEVPALNNFVFIGFPATESANPLIVPLAGHEIGHSLWISSNGVTRYKKHIHDCLISILERRLGDFKNAIQKQDLTVKDISENMFVIQTWAPTVFWTEKQAEESFCDFVGLRLFGAGYFFAFAYLLSPSVGGKRSYRYPNLRKRIKNLVAAAGRYGIKVPSDYEQQFEDFEQAEGTRTDLFLLEVADECLQTTIPTLIDDADNLLSTRSVPTPSSDEIRRIVDSFRRVVPATRARSVADILNAAWDASEDVDLWKGIPTIEDDREVVLRELVLKNFEVLDIENTLGAVK